MKLSKKILLRSIPALLLVVVLLSSNVFGFSNFSPDMNVEADTNTSLVGSVNKIWGVVLTVLQVCAIGALVFAGVRYMFASADQKAELKKSLGILAVGAILVFGASTVVSFLTGAFNEIAGQ